MRLISQDRLDDISYELFEISIIAKCKRISRKVKTTVYQICAVKGDNEYIMGEYFAKEKALEVMKDLREGWTDDLAFFYFP